MELVFEKFPRLKSLTLYDLSNEFSRQLESLVNKKKLSISNIVAADGKSHPFGYGGHNDLRRLSKILVKGKKLETLKIGSLFYERSQALAKGDLPSNTSGVPPTASFILLYSTLSTLSTDLLVLWRCCLPVPV